MVVVSRPRMPAVERKGCPVPGEVLFKRRAGTANGAAQGDEASGSFSATRCGGVMSKDQRIPVQRALSVLRRVGERPGSVESESVACASVSVASEFCAYPYRVASASQSTAFGSARAGFPSSTLPLLLKSLARRAAAAKVSRRWRRLEDASRGVASPVLRPVRVVPRLV
jgi:hypothetical protein